LMVLRSMLYVPGNSMRMITSAASRPADAVILDLEDAVPIADKETARIMIRDSIRLFRPTETCTFVRVNSLNSGSTAEDLEFVVVDELDGVMLPKTEGSSDVVKLDEMLAKTEKSSGLKPESLKIIPLIETAKGVVRAFEIASASSRVVAVAFGAGDYYRDLGRDVSLLSRDETELLFARSQIVVASRAAGTQAVDTPFLGLLTDKERFLNGTKLALQLGFKGKQVIHPSQIEPVNSIFSPSRNEIDSAKRLVAAFGEAQARGLGAASFEGRMIDCMSYKQAKDLLGIAEAMAKRESIRNKGPLTLDLSQIFS
jgi:citrate lyase subunit beta/citryl-CoA lyase